MNDLTKEKSCAITNPANSQLRNGKGAALSIKNAAGKEFQDECNEYIKINGPIPVGSAAATSAGKMRDVKFIIHAVGPMYKNYDEYTNHQLLQSVVLNILQRSKELGIEVVSIPAISSGLFGFPKEKCAEIMLRYTTAWFLRGKCGKVKCVRMCNFDKSTVNVFLNEMEIMEV